MDGRRFDFWTKTLLGSGSRRRVLAAAGAGALGALMPLLRPAVVGAACPPRGCGIGNCCIDGTCRPKCDGQCCADCFAEQNPVSKAPIPGTEFCCAPGSICGGQKPGPADDRCCYPDGDVCINGKCCCDGCLGAVVCGGKCCPAASCCNGECCEKGKVCARKTATGPKQCVSANRTCGRGKPPCYVGEQCVGGVCCKGDRICQDEDGNPVCCAAGEYCDPSNVGGGGCCPVNRRCGTWRPQRIRA